MVSHFVCTFCSNSTHNCILLVLCYKDSEPDFGLAQEVHVKAKKEQQNEFKQASSAAALLGISEKALACITGAILVADSEASEHYKKINIGLQLKSRNYVSNWMRLIQVPSGFPKCLFVSFSSTLARSFFITIMWKTSTKSFSTRKRPSIWWKRTWINSLASSSCWMHPRQWRSEILTKTTIAMVTNIWRRCVGGCNRCRTSNNTRSHRMYCVCQTKL